VPQGGSCQVQPVQSGFTLRSENLLPP